MRTYIEINTKLRNAPDATEFERELYKLLNNAMYGKTFENPLKYCLLVFLSTLNAYQRAVSKPGFDGTVYMQDDFCMAKMLYETIKYEKPLYLGATITELAKLKMYDFYYNVLQDYFVGGRKCELLFTDLTHLC